MPHRAAIVIPLHERADLTGPCLAALERTGTLEHAQVVLVDNASTDGTADLCREWSDRVTVIRNPVNLGFAPACNQGARAAAAPVVVFLNNDTLVHDGWLDPLLAAVEDPRVGVAGARLLYPGGRVQHAGMAVMPGCVPVHIHRYAPGDHPAVTRTRDLTAVTGACMAVRRDRFLEAGAFDEGYRNGYEDTDLCLRLAAQGFTARYCGDSVVTHLESMSPGRLDHDHINGARFRRRWRDWTPDLARLLAEDGIEDLAPPDVIWRGPLMDASPEARVGRGAVAALAAAGMRPAALEIPAGDAMEGLGPLLGAEVLAAVNRPYLSRGVARVYHHVTDAERTPAPVPGCQLVVVHPPEIVLPEGVPGDAVLELAEYTDPAVAADRILGPLPERPEGVGYWGPAVGSGPAAITGRALAWALADGGRPVRLVATDSPEAGPEAALPALGPQDFLPGLWIATGPPAAPGGGGWEQPVTAAGGRLAGWCWADAEGVPAPWWGALRWADEVWVPSEWTLRAFCADGVDPDTLRVVPVPVDTASFAPPAAPPPATPVTLLAVLEWSWLGGWDALVRAFVEEFAPDEPVRLRLVCRRRAAGSPEADVLALLRAMGRDPVRIPDLDLVPVPPDDAALAEAMRTAHALVHPVRGEGLGRELLCAMASGLPVIGTDTGAHHDLVAEGGLVVPGRHGIPVTPTTAAGDPALVGLRAADPDHDALRAALRRAADDHAALRAAAAPLVARVTALAGREAVAATVAARVEHLLARTRTGVRH